MRAHNQFKTLVKYAFLKAFYAFFCLMVILKIFSLITLKNYIHQKKVFETYKKRMSSLEYYGEVLSISGGNHFEGEFFQNDFFYSPNWTH